MPKHSIETRRKVAEALAATITPATPHGVIVRAAEIVGVNRNSILSWLKTKAFKALIEEAKQARYSAMAAPGDKDKSPLMLLKETRQILALRLQSEAGAIPIEKVADAYAKIDTVIRLEEGLPTGITEERIREYAAIVALPDRELRAIFESKVRQIPAAMQAVENPLAEDAEFEEIEH